NRNSLSNETGLLKEWPEGGPKSERLFEDCGAGFCGRSIVAVKLYILGAREGEDFILCLDAAKGTEVWKASMGAALKNDWSDGSRGTAHVVAGFRFALRGAAPVADGFVYALVGAGTIICVQAADGKEVWRTTMKDLGTPKPPT